MTTVATSQPLSPLARLAPLWVALGAVGSVILVLFGTMIGALPRPGTTTWWFTLSGINNSLVHIAFYAGVLLVLIGWWGLGAYARQGQLSVAKCWGVLVVWATPLFLGPPLWSRDLYSYVAQGDLAHAGMNPYKVAPDALGPGPITSSISTVWLHTTSPYGPLFVMVSKQLSAIGGSLIEQLFIYRGVELIGIALLMVCLPPLARRLGSDPGVALWLAVLSPLALWSYVASGHNDTLMIGLMIAGIAVAKSGRRELGIALCAVGAAIKLPAAGAIVFFIAEAFVKGQKKDRVGVVAKGALITLVVLVGITMLSGLGWAWLSPAALKIPTEIRVLSTPLVSLGNFIGAILHNIGLPITVHTMISIVRLLGSTATALAVLYLLWQVRSYEIVRLIGVALLVVVLGSPTVWPWYFMWAVAVLAATSAQRSKALAALAALAMLVVGAGGTPILNGWMVWITGPLMVVAIAYFASGQRWKRVIGEPQRVA